MRRAELALIALLGIGGCSAPAAGIGRTAAGQLAPQVEQVKAAAIGGDRATAAAKLAQLRASVADLRQRNQLSEAGAAKVLAAAAELEAQLGSPPPTAPPAPQTATTVVPPNLTPATRPPQQPGRGGDNKGRGSDKEKD